MFHVVLYQPEIPQNTGNIIRLCANTGAYLHLIHPLGFALEDKYVRRAGFDYHEWVSVMQYRSLDDFNAQVQPPRLFALSTKGRRHYTESVYQAEDTFLFGPETRGLPAALLNRLGTDQVLRIPMRPHNRSLNLSNAVAIVVYEAWRQLGFIDAR